MRRHMDAAWPKMTGEDCRRCVLETPKCGGGFCEGGSVVELGGSVGGIRVGAVCEFILAFWDVFGLYSIIFQKL